MMTACASVRIADRHSPDSCRVGRHSCCASAAGAVGGDDDVVREEKPPGGRTGSQDFRLDLLHLTDAKRVAQGGHHMAKFDLYDYRLVHSARYQKSPLFPIDRKSTRLNSSHGYISYAVFCLKKKQVSVVRNAGAGLQCLM